MQHAVVTTTSGQMTVQEWAAMPEDEPGELRDGLLEDEEVADRTHETAVLWLGTLLRTWASALGGFAFGSEVCLFGLSASKTFDVKSCQIARSHLRTWDVPRCYVVHSI